MVANNSRAITHHGMTELKFKIADGVIGSFGTVQDRFLSVLLNCGMSKVLAKLLVKWCATSYIIAAKNIWKLQCKIVNRSSSK